MTRCCDHNHDHDHDHKHDHAHDHDHDHDHAHDRHAAGHGPVATHRVIPIQAADTCCTPSAPPLETLEAARAVEGGVRTAIRILQMDCPTEEALLRKKLGGLGAVRHLEFNLMQRVLTVVHAPDGLEAVLSAIRALGFTPEQPDASGQLAAVPAPAATGWPFGLALAGAAALASELASWAGLPVWLIAGLSLAAVALSGIGTYRKGWTALRHGNLNINALMSIAVTGALLIGQWPEAAMVMVLFTLAERIEARSLDRARDAIAGLLKLMPERVTVRQPDGAWREIGAGEVSVGSLARVRPGERIGLDGVIVSGRSSVNQAPITGESLPVDKAEGDTVFAGTINEAGAFEYRVTAAASSTALARIIHAVEAAQGARAPTQRFVDRFARVYTPAVFGLALLVALLPPLLLGAPWPLWLYKALVLLVIACPCALVISTPVTVVSGLAAAARRGILIKGGVYLEEGRKLRWLALDKTGTLTHGRPELTDFEPCAAPDAQRCRGLAARLAARSDHPVSQAIVRASSGGPEADAAVTDFMALPGRGVSGTMDGHAYVLGNHRLLHERGLCTPALEARLDALERQGKTVVMLADAQQVLALFAVADTVKASSREAIEALHGLGVRTLMLTGDNPHTAEAIARQVGIDEARGNQLPQDKLQAVAALGGQGMVGMVGDGINDAPALARADIGFAMGALGTDAAIETADVALMDDDLRKIPQFVRLSHATRAVLLQNIALALGIKALFLTLTLLGLGSMWMAVFADVGASLLVVGNGLRLLRR